MSNFQDFGAAESEIRLPHDALSGSLIHRHGLSCWMPLVIFAASIIVTLIFWKALPNSFSMNQQSDYFTSYEPAARGLLAGRGFTHADETAATEYPPGYPLILAGIFEICHRLHIPEAVGLSVFELVGMGLSSVLMFFLARLIWGARAALVSASLWMTYPFALWLTRQPNSEIPFIVAFYATLLLFWYALVRRPRARAIYFVCGLLCGFAMLIRPIAMGVGILLAGIIWFVRREAATPARLLLIGLLLLGNLVAVIPWEVWAHAKTGNVILLSTNGVKSLRDGVTFAVATKGYREGSSVPSDVVQVMDDVYARIAEIETFKDFALVMSQEFRSHPVGVSKLVFLKLARSWYATDSGRKEWPILLVQLAYLTLISWGSWKAWKRGGIHREFVISALLIAVYFWGMTFLALSILRYTVPVIGLLFVASAGGYSQALRSNKAIG